MMVTRAFTLASVVPTPINRALYSFRSVSARWRRMTMTTKARGRRDKGGAVGCARGVRTPYARHIGLQVGYMGSPKCVPVFESIEEGM